MQTARFVRSSLNNGQIRRGDERDLILAIGQAQYHSLAGDLRSRVRCANVSHHRCSIRFGKYRRHQITIPERQGSMVRLQSPEWQGSEKLSHWLEELRPRCPIVRIVNALAAVPRVPRPESAGRAPQPALFSTVDAIIIPVAFLSAGFIAERWFPMRARVSRHSQIP